MRGWVDRCVCVCVCVCVGRVASQVDLSFVLVIDGNASDSDLVVRNMLVS